jgi:hypothetical protein
LASIPSARAPANPPGLEQRDLETALREFHRARHAREAATDYGNVSLDAALERREGRIDMQR